MEMSQVPGEDNLYIGGIINLKYEYLRRTKVSHIISVLRLDLNQYSHLREYKHLRIDADDVENENLIENFEKSGAWIEDALRNENNEKQNVVLVHCAMGISRSVTIVLAYLLRKDPSLEVNDLLAHVRKTRPEAQPNIGFMKQLIMYKKMGCPRDVEANPLYQSWIYQREIDIVRDMGVPPKKIRFLDETKSFLKQNDKPEIEMELRCRKCRRKIAATPYIVQHTPKSESFPAEQGQIVGKPADRRQCTSHFVHPLSWMRPTLEKGLLSGRLECPNSKCASLVGRYSWQGQRCSCHAWVCPSFSLQKSRCDEIIRSK